MNKLDEILQYALQHNEYYRKCGKMLGHVKECTIDDFPCVDKNMLCNNELSLLSDNYKGMAFNTLLRRTTSSSSGMPLSVYWDKTDYVRSTMSLWRFRKKYYNISPSSRQLNFTLNQYQITHQITGLEYTINKNVISFSRSSFLKVEDYDAFYNVMFNFQPEWIYIQPFVLNDIVWYLKEKKLVLPNSVRYIESVGEVLPYNIRKKAEDYLKIQITNMYGSEEMNGIAIECPYRNMHILDDNVYVECLANNKISNTGEGEIILTNLNNHAMPLIRYVQGDIVNIKAGGTCKCGCESKHITVIKGRKHESFENNGVKINSFMLTEVINSLNNIMGDPILKFKFIYSKKKKELRVYIIISSLYDSWKESIKSTLVELFQKENIVGLNIIIIPTDSINSSLCSKYKILEVVDE